ncbi:MAG TPA: hypothetical protein PLP83_02350 [Candidatus Aminicenantes bacterium]|nr:hypothetical protein [Candidatus Aminicenantes bacterium]
MTEDDKDRRGYYQAIARAFLERRGAPFLLSPRDQALIASWEARRIPLRVVLEGIGRTFDGLRSRGRSARGVPLGRCEKQVDEAFAQHRDRGAGGRGPAAAAGRPDKAARVRREIEKALEGPAGEDAEVAVLLRRALDVLGAGRPDEAALERTEEDIEELLWVRAAAAEGAAAEDAAGRRLAVRAARAALRVPHVSLFYH